MERLDGGVLEVRDGLGLGGVFEVLDGLGFTIFSNTENLPMVVTVKEVHVLKCPVTYVRLTITRQDRLQLF